MEQQIVLISGTQGSGKTTTVKELERILVSRRCEVGYFRFAHVIYEIHDMARDMVTSSIAMGRRDASEIARMVHNYAIGKLVEYRFLSQPEVDPAFEQNLFRWSDKVLHDPFYFERCKAKDGELLQWLGTEWGRSKDENIWAKICRSRILHWFENSVVKVKDSVTHAELVEPVARKMVAIVDDCRFENEFDILPEALRIRLMASEAVRKARAGYWRENTEHPSETGLNAYEAADKFDMKFNTEGGVSVTHICTLISAQLDKMSWSEKRGK